MEGIRWVVSDEGMQSGEESPWSDGGFPPVDLSPETKKTLRSIASDVLADINNRLSDACLPPDTETTGLAGNAGLTPGDGSEADLEERVAELEATTARKAGGQKALSPTLIIVVTNPDGSLSFPGTGKCFAPVKEDGSVPKAKCPKGMPAETEMRHAIRQYFTEPEPLRDQHGRFMFDSQGRPILFPSWSDFQVTPEYAQSLKSADEPLYLPYKWNNAESDVVWTQEDIGKAARQWAGVSPDGGLSNEDIEKLQKLQIEAPPAGSLKPAPNAGKPTTSKATGKSTQPAQPKETTQPAPRNEVRDEVIKGIIQFGIGKVIEGDRRRED
jgi:hypothetical protein